MELDRSLLKEFAQITNDTQEDSKAKQYVRGTVTSGGDRKYVIIDGSEMLTPISEVVDVEDGDRVLVSVENHKATIIGNFTFPPSARKEQEALDNANSAIEGSNTALEKAQSASEKADTAITESSAASALAGEAKNEASEAMTAAQNASQNAEEAKTQASEAKQQAADAQTAANESKDAVSATNKELSAIKSDVAGVKTDISDALSDLESQAGEIETIKTTYSTKIEIEQVKADLSTEITTKVGELQTTVSETYAAKTEVVEIQGALQTQITQNAEGISSQASKVEKLEADTAAAQESVDKALADAAAAQSAANAAQSTANSAQASADQAKSDAATAQTKADNAQAAADAAQEAVDIADKSLQQAKADLDEAKQNLANVTSRVDATEEEIADAQSKVDAANTAVNQALEDVAEANLAASNAQAAADKAQSDANTAKTAANNAQTAADNAKTVADNAAAQALQAQNDVAALTNRVTTAETNISQNAEQIALNATKTTEISNKVDGVETNLSNNYYNKEQVDAAISVEAGKITSSVSETYLTKTEGSAISDAANNALNTANSANSKIDNLEIGGRNLLLNSEFGDISDSLFNGSTAVLNGEDLLDGNPRYEMSGYNYIKVNFPILKIGERYTFSCDIARYSGGSSQPALITIDDSTINVGTAIGGIWTNFSVTFTATDTSTYALIRVNNANDDGAHDYLGHARHFKLEKGDKATDWTPAPEDVEEDCKNYADDAVSDATVTITETYESLIEETAKQINLMIQQLTEITNDQGTFISTMSNQLQLTTEMAQFVKTTTEQLQDVVDGKVSATEIQEWARFDGATLELGASNQPFKAKLSTTELAFYQGDNKVAWISNNELHILTAIITSSIGCGNFTWIDEGDLGLSLI